MKDALEHKNQDPKDFIGLEIELKSKENQRGWIQEASKEGLIIGLYPEGNELKVEWDYIDKGLLSRPPLPIMDGFVAIDFVSKEDEKPISSIRIADSDYKLFCRAAKSLNQDFESFIQDALIAGIEKELLNERK